MKYRIVTIASIFLFAAIIFISCKKNAATTSTATTATEMSAQADDQSIVTTEVDNVANDINTTVQTSASLSGFSTSSLRMGTNSVIGLDTVARINLPSSICDATISFDTTGSTKTVTITYNGSTCNGNRLRSGIITFSMPLGIKWKDAGAAITVTYKNFKVTRVRDSKSITINGTHTITNVSGGLLANLASLGTITHTINSSNMVITFDNGTNRSWSVAKKRVFTYNNGIVITTTGTHIDGALLNISEWGTNRYGNNFNTDILQPLVIRQDCDFRLTSGQVQHTNPSIKFTTTFGLDSFGNATSCPGTGTYYFKIIWVDASSQAHTVIAPY